MSQMPEGEDAPLYRTEVRFNSIYVLESLRLGDAKTGEDLYDTVIFPGKVRQEDMYTVFVQIPTRKILIERLILIAQAAERANHRPIIHIEAHGGADGIELTSGEYVSWRDLIPIFTRINIACKNNLESPRDCRRLPDLRGWEYGKAQAVLARGA